MKTETNNERNEECDMAKQRENVRDFSDCRRYFAVRALLASN
jgi:hypothetical protein